MPTVAPAAPGNIFRSVAGSNLRAKRPLCIINQNHPTRNSTYLNPWIRVSLHACNASLIVVPGPRLSRAALFSGTKIKSLNKPCLRPYSAQKTPQCLHSLRRTFVDLTDPTTIWSRVKCILSHHQQVYTLWRQNLAPGSDFCRQIWDPGAGAHHHGGYPGTVLLEALYCYFFVFPSLPFYKSRNLPRQAMRNSPQGL